MEPAVVLGALCEQLARRLGEATDTLTATWLERVQEMLAVEDALFLPSHQIVGHVPDLIRAIATSIGEPGSPEAVSERALLRADELGELRHTQHASVGQVMREYEILSDVLTTFVERELGSIPTAEPIATVRALRRMDSALRLLQRRSLSTLVVKYTETLERQTAQLRRFSRLVSHEIRQPLAVLQVVARTLPVDAGSVDAARMMDIFDRSVGRLTEVTGKLERLARMTRSTDLSPRARRVDLLSLVTAVADQLHDAALAQGVTIDIRPNLPVLWTDPARAELVFLNLLANAIKFADPSKTERRVEIAGVAGRVPSVIVRDNGIGIPAPRLQHIFREFVRAHAQRDDDMTARGLGLGLSIVRECMDHANGSVRIESREGRGTTFKLSWPAAPAG